jgi:hypothetical protein
MPRYHKHSEGKATGKVYGRVKGAYDQKSVRTRIEALLLDNIGKIVTREMIIKAATDPVTGRQPENWHQRLSELRTDAGYTILSWRDDPNLAVEEYVMPSAEKRVLAGKRVKPTPACWEKVLANAGHACEWAEDGQPCGLREGDVDPVGGGRVRLTPDHKSPHSLDPNADPCDPNRWRALCGRHQVMKKNYWDNQTGKLNIAGILQAASEREKRAALNLLLKYFGYTLEGGRVQVSKPDDRSK